MASVQTMGFDHVGVHPQLNLPRNSQDLPVRNVQARSRLMDLRARDQRDPRCQAPLPTSLAIYRRYRAAALRRRSDLCSSRIFSSAGTASLRMRSTFLLLSRSKSEAGGPTGPRNTRSASSTHFNLLVALAFGSKRPDSIAASI